MLYRIKIIKFDLDNLHIFHETNHGGTEIICENRYTSFPLNSAQIKKKKKKKLTMQLT